MTQTIESLKSTLTSLEKEASECCRYGLCVQFRNAAFKYAEDNHIQECWDRQVGICTQRKKQIESLKTKINQIEKHDFDELHKGDLIRRLTDLGYDVPPRLKDPNSGLRLTDSEFETIERYLDDLDIDTHVVKILVQKLLMKISLRS